MTTDKPSGSDLRARLAHHTGSASLIRHPFNKACTYTEGVEDFANSAGAYWLLDILMTEPAIVRGMKTEGFVVIELDVKDEKARLIVKRDTHDPELFSRAIDFTDCPEGLWRFYFTDNVLMLPGEY